ncbi:hypothetical protein KSP39_PZI021473 [Platanthera zijinensis]|uniref:Expansin-like EG45 domain-containing protein n=1 Tax=Platanthera zijinensis TaxID=2320716 RepID=A0AAP0AXX2_9ASPA
MSAASACFGFKDQGVALISLSDKLWDDGRACGQRYIVSCRFELGNDCVEQSATFHGLEAMVVDNCGDCDGNDMQLSEPIFAGIAKLDAETAVISYRRFS